MGSRNAWPKTHPGYVLRSANSMARYKCADQPTPLYHDRDGDRPLAQLNAGVEVGSTGPAVPGPPGHGQILPVFVPTRDMNGWIYMSELTLV